MPTHIASSFSLPFGNGEPFATTRAYSLRCISNGHRGGAPGALPEPCGTWAGPYLVRAISDAVGDLRLAMGLSLLASIGTAVCLFVAGRWLKTDEESKWLRAAEAGREDGLKW